ncbi:hypothetical protein evm_009129 [Chilo suppressalis]|nr:hypothetical protein evm_009129 [Chilo suppressalis]
MILLLKILASFTILGVDCFESTCNRSEYLDPSSMTCQMCPVNVSMVVSVDGFSCICEDNSIPDGIARCRQCNSTEVVSADGASCVPRRCQIANNRYICRKCPSDYISVTQNVDGSPAKEVQCVKCARGYKAQNNVCVRCPSCVCAKTDIAVKNACISKKFLSERPRYEGNMPATLLMVLLKNEYLCTKGDILACRALAAGCVHGFYSTNAAGPCRLWLQPKSTPPRGLPDLVIAPSTSEKSPGEFILAYGMESLLLVLAVYTYEGGLKILKLTKDKQYPCFLPIEVSIGKDMSYDCNMNVTQLLTIDRNSTYAVYVDLGGVLKPIPIAMRKPGDYHVKRGTWSSGHFRRFFLVGHMTTTDNVTSTVYIRKLHINIRVERDTRSATSLRLQIHVEAHYERKTSVSPSVTTSLRVEHEMPSAGIRRGLEIWGGVLSTLLSLYAIVQWRGVMKRGGLHFTLLPILCGYLSDALYFSVWFSTLHALAAEAGTLGLTLPLSYNEEHFIKSFVYSAFVLKSVNIAWLNWKQCFCDIFLLDWSEFNPVYRDVSINNHDEWRTRTLAREWSRVQTLRRAPPSYTVILTLVIINLTSYWWSYVHQSGGYNWAAAGIAWWASYGVILAFRWALDRLAGSPLASIPSICRGVGLSLLVFQEEHYAHYVHGRSEDNKEMRMMSRPLSMCRIAMAPQLRIVYNQLSSYTSDDSEAFAKRALLSKLLAAFFERALDGLNWVASERTVLERLLNVELTERESGTTSVLLYDSYETTPSCVALTWWGEEWSLGTLDAMIFGLVVLITDEPLLAALTTIVLWQVMQNLRHTFGQRNQMKKTNIII